MDIKYSIPIKNMCRENYFIKGACGVSGWDIESNERMYKRFGMGMTAKGVDCRVVEWEKHHMLR